MWADWLNTTIGEQVRLQRGIDITKAEQRAGCVPVVSSGGIASYHETAYAKAPGVVLGRKGSVGTVFYLAEDYWPHDTSLWVTDFRGNNPRFVYYFFLNFAEKLKTMDVGSANPALNRNHVHPLKTTWPQKEEQRAIARVLGALDDKIELNQRMNRTLEELAAALFRSWFVDFDPVVAKVAGRPPAHLRPALAALFPATFQDSPLGPIPHGWRVSRLADLCTTQYGYTTSATDEPIGPKFLRVMDINKRNWIEWGSVPHCVVPPKEKDKYALHIGDLVVARMADPGKSAIIEEEVNAVFASYLVRLKTHSLRDAYYLYGFLKSDLYLDYAESVKTGSVQSNMNANVIVDVDVVLPPENILSAFLDFVLPLRKQIIHNVRESRTLAALRDTLLPKLLSGELRVKAAEKLVEANV